MCVCYCLDVVQLHKHTHNTRGGARAWTHALGRIKTQDWDWWPHRCRATTQIRRNVLLLHGCSPHPAPAQHKLSATDRLLLHTLSPHNIWNNTATAWPWLLPLLGPTAASARDLGCLQSVVWSLEPVGGCPCCCRCLTDVFACCAEAHLPGHQAAGRSHALSGP